MRRKCRRPMRVAAILSCLLIWAGAFSSGQSGSQGTVIISVVDTSGGVVPQTSLELVDLATNDRRIAASSERGTYTFVNLLIGTYRLTATRPGYSTTVLDAIVVHAAQATEAVVTLKVGQTSETVNVDASATPLLESSSNAIGTVVDLKQIEDLPMQGRDLTALAKMTPGYTGDVTEGHGVWNGQPFSNQGSNIDGVVGGASRGKYDGNVAPSASPRIENIEEMNVQTDQLDLDQGFGQATMQVNFVTRRGTNQFHGRIYADFRNSGLNANTWYNDAVNQRKAKLIYNDFGASLGGPILHDRLFFFGALSTRRVPQNIQATNKYFPSAVQSGNFTYTGTNGTTYTENLFALAKAYNATLPGSLNSAVANELTAINNSLSAGSISASSDPNVNNISWNTSAPLIFYYPTVRLDYNFSQKLRMSLAWNMTQEMQDGVNYPNFPGSGFSNQAAGYQTRSYTASYGLDWELAPTLINQFKFGFLYDENRYGNGAKPLYASEPTVDWNMENFLGYSSYTMSGQQYQLPVSNYYPVFNASDAVSWQKGKHTIKFGVSWYREQDHYWNPPAGFPTYFLGLASGDPAVNAFSNGSTGTLPYASSTKLSEAKQVYAILAGRISSVSGQYAYSSSTDGYKKAIGAYNLNELQSAWGLFFQDSWKVKPSLTVNYGLRWDFTGDDHDLTKGYHSATPSGIYGPSGVGNLFRPGYLPGDANPILSVRSHVYDPWNVTPQPAIGFAWSPQKSSGTPGKLLGSGQTVIRGGFSLRRYTMPQQYYWNGASNYGAFFYQNFYLNSNTTGTAGTFTPGSLSLGSTLPAYGYAPASYQSSEAEADFTFLNTVGINGIDPHIKQPYSESWNFGVQRQFGSRVLEIRYNGNRSLHQWIAVNPNEVNIFENGFLTEFKHAKANYAANHAAGIESFAYNGLSGQAKLPIFDAAFAGEGFGGSGVGLEDYANSTFLNYIQTGQAGAMANVLAGVSGTTTYFCNLVGASFTPCVNNAGYSGAGAGYPINFFQANPFASGTSTGTSPSSSGYMTASGYSNYHALQIDLRQQAWKGLQMDGNYTFGKTLGLGSTRCWTGCADNLMTLRNPRRGYGPTPYDLRQVLHITGTYDLPIGSGKALLNNNNLTSRILGNWTIGSILTFQTGAPEQLTGGNMTYNDYADGGIVLSGVTRKQLQQSVGVHRIPGQTYAALIDPKYLASSTGNGANSTYINPNTTPGTIGDVLYLYGPHGFYHDVSLSKTFPIRESLKFRFQSEFLNIWNHPVFGSAPYSFGNVSQTFQNSVQSSSFGTGSVTNMPRVIELRANIEF